MSRLLLSVALICAIPMSASSEGLWKSIKKGASEAGQAVGNTASDVGTAVGNTASDVGTAIDNTVEGTATMLSNEDTPEATRARMDGVANETLQLLLAENPEAAALFEKSYGYAAFDARQLTLIGAAAGYGRGVAVVRETDARTYMKMGTGGVGISFGIGGFERKLVIMFEDTALYHQFVENGYDATAEASTMVGDDNDRGDVQFVEGRRVFYLSKKGWRVATTATGTKYWKDKDLN
ncbi:hypothetical protein [Shimia sediminis]|uniref:hypothetical protein n=1 Tax=Shimia sediminis TaxID=2497945 RepID=UPI000F8E3EFB|nr:hypothetical protein [Shimia sediminis]